MQTIFFYQFKNVSDPRKNRGESIDPHPGEHISKQARSESPDFEKEQGKQQVIVQMEGGHIKEVPNQRP